MGIQVLGGLPGANDVPGNLSLGQQPSTATSATAAANTVVTITLAAIAGSRHRLTMLGYSYSAAPTGGRITIADGATTLIDIDITSTWEVHTPLPPGGIGGTTNTAMVVTLAAGGAGIIGKLWVSRLTF